MSSLCTWNEYLITSDIVSVSSKKFFDIQATLEGRLYLKRVRDKIITYSQIKWLMGNIL